MAICYTIHNTLLKSYVNEEKKIKNGFSAYHTFFQ